MKNIFFLGILMLCSMQSFCLNSAHFTLTRISAPYFLVDGNQPTTITRAYVGFEVKNNTNSATTYSGLIFNVTSIATSVSGQNFTILSPTSNEVRVGTLAPGETKACYFYVSYPASVSTTASLNPEATFNVKLSDATVNSMTQAFVIKNRRCISANAGGLNTQSIVNQDLLGGIVTDTVTYQVGNAQNNDEVDFQVAISTQFQPSKFSLLSTTVVSSTVPGVAAGTTDSLYFITGNGGNGQSVRIAWKFRIVGYNYTNFLLPCAGATSGSTNYKYALDNTLTAAGGVPVTVSANANPLTLNKENPYNYTPCAVATFRITVYNPAAYGVTLDSITDQLPTGFTFLGFAAGSGITASNCSSYPALNATGNIKFVGGVNNAGNISFYVPAGGSLLLSYTANTSCTQAFNLSSTTTGYVGPTSFSSDVNGFILPLDLLTFGATNLNGKVQLNWSTANEQNTQSFTIQHRNNAAAVWNNLGEVKPAGSLNGTNHYNFIHNYPAPGNNTYRLLMTDLDGKKTYSKEISVPVNVKGGGIKIFGNPVENGMLKIYSETGGMMQLINAKGQTLISKKIIGGNQVIDVSTMPKGIYNLKVEDTTIKVVIK